MQFQFHKQHYHN